jgi:hypothetical protein
VPGFYRATAAVRAKTRRARNPVRVFIGIVRKGIWAHLTNADEERARQALNRYRHGACQAACRAGRGGLPAEPGFGVGHPGMPKPYRCEVSAALSDPAGRPLS